MGSPELKDVKRSLHTTWNQSLNDSIPFDDSIPMYPHHEWPISLMINRRRTGLSDPLINFPQEQSGVVGRAKTEVQRRVSSIESFSLPWPMDTDWPNGPELSRKKALTRLKARYLNSYTRSTETGGEFLWNRLIIDLLRQKKCAMINGNHDCYRGDPILKGMDVTWEVESWYSKDGVWIEHGHRWDAYNQDGMPFGAAVTNQAHYNMRPLIQNSDKAKSAILPTFHEETIPSCAQWFLMVNGRSQKGSYYPTPYFQQTQSNIVNPFSVYVVGHSHNPDLLTVSFKRN